VKSAALTHSIIGAAMEVHSQLGPGFLESIYKHALLHELSVRGLATQTELELIVSYRSFPVGKHRLDSLVEGTVIVELKAVAALNELHRAQVISYLMATGLELALIINFGAPQLLWKRLIKSRGFRGLRGSFTAKPLN
jgi:GxxExxY protein